MYKKNFQETTSKKFRFVTVHFVVVILIRFLNANVGKHISASYLQIRSFHFKVIKEEISLLQIF